ncbi:MAG: hypothetical protein Q8R07_06190 [Candidatus Uhrbacteria bacterium]|nr:hypothetical protein [Candidatus Uhrbacteria bacterium]
MEIETAKDRGPDLLPGKSQNYEKELKFIMDAIVESAIEDSVGDILAEGQEGDPEVEDELQARNDLRDAIEAITSKVSTSGPQSREEALTRGRTSFLLTAEARHLIRMIAGEMGMAQAAALEILLREKAHELNIQTWSPGTKESVGGE